MIYESLGQLIWDRRLSAGLSAQELAEKLGVPRGVVVRWEEDRSRPSRESREALAVIIGGYASDYA
jgi:transcriptional regulator with XRE-family HTH domain